MVTFTARRSKPELVVPARATPREVKSLSDIDNQPYLRLYATIIEFFRRRVPGAPEQRAASSIIKAAVAEALVYYYPVAGRLRKLPGGNQLVVDCTAEGVVFVEAYADVRLEDFGEPLVPPYPCVDELICEAAPESGDHNPAAFAEPERATPREVKSLSDVDNQPYLRLYATMIEFFRRRVPGVPEQRAASSIIKATVAEALVYYYPVAGRLRELPGGDKLVVDCTAEGVVFVEAHADVRLEDFGSPLVPPYPCVDELICEVGDLGAVVRKPLLYLQVLVFSPSYLYVCADGHCKLSKLSSKHF
ncbi:hypothetical protein ACQ4PT_044279 [Festuca glaucescens]